MPAADRTLRRRSRRSQGRGHAADNPAGRWPGGSIISAEPPGRAQQGDDDNDTADRPVLVTGATGNTGRAIIDALAGRGTPVRAMVRPIAAEGRFYAPIGDARVSAVDVRDIAAAAAIALTGPGHEGATCTLTGPAAITHGDTAAALTSALGRDITFTDVPPGAFANSLRDSLLPWQIQGLLEDYAHYRHGEAASVSPAVAEITGRPATDVWQFARHYARIYSPAEPRRRVLAESPAAAEYPGPHNAVLKGGAAS